MAKRPATTGAGTRPVPQAVPKSPGAPNHPAAPSAAQPGQNISYPVRHPNVPVDPGTRRRVGLSARNPGGSYGGQQQQIGRR